MFTLYIYYVIFNLVRSKVSLGRDAYHIGVCTFFKRKGAFLFYFYLLLYKNRSNIKIITNKVTIKTSVLNDFLNIINHFLTTAFAEIYVLHIRK